MTIETANVTSADNHRYKILARKVNMQFNQETCLTEAQKSTLVNEARKKGKSFIGGPLDPEQTGKPSAGVGMVADQALGVYPLTKPTQHYLDAVKTGRIQIVCCDINGQTLVVANIYGWTGGRPGTPEAERTDDLICICKVQFESMAPGPKAICGDFNGPIEAFPS